MRSSINYQVFNHQSFLLQAFNMADSSKWEFLQLYHHLQSIGTCGLWNGKMCICRTLLYVNRGVHMKWDLLFCIPSHMEIQHGQHLSCSLHAKSFLCSGIPQMELIYVRNHIKKQWPICRWDNGPICEPPTETELMARACFYHPEICYEFDMQKPRILL